MTSELDKIIEVLKLNNNSIPQNIKINTDNTTDDEGISLIKLDSELEDQIGREKLSFNKGYLAFRFVDSILMTSKYDSKEIIQAGKINQLKESFILSYFEKACTNQKLTSDLVTYAEELVNEAEYSHIRLLSRVSKKLDQDQNVPHDHIIQSIWNNINSQSNKENIGQSFEENDPENKQPVETLIKRRLHSRGTITIAKSIITLKDNLVSKECIAINNKLLIILNKITSEIKSKNTSKQKTNTRGNINFELPETLEKISETIWPKTDHELLTEKEFKDYKINKKNSQKLITKIHDKINNLLQKDTSTKYEYKTEYYRLLIKSRRKISERIINKHIKQIHESCLRLNSITNKMKINKLLSQIFTISYPKIDQNYIQLQEFINKYNNTQKGELELTINDIVTKINLAKQIKKIRRNEFKMVLQCEKVIETCEEIIFKIFENNKTTHDNKQIAELIIDNPASFTTNINNIANAYLIRIEGKRMPKRQKTELKQSNTESQNKTPKQNL